jgi:hypothetical protein
MYPRTILGFLGAKVEKKIETTKFFREKLINLYNFF